MARDVLLPFQVGAVLACLFLPLVNRLDRHMPRPSAILLVFGVGLVGADVVAVLKITDNVFGNYVRGQLILGLMVGGSAFLGLHALSLLGIEGIHSTLLLGIFAGITELIPTIGPIIGAIPAVIMGLFMSWKATIAIVLLYVLIQQIENAVLVPRVTGNALNIYPAILMLVLVALSQFGLLWAILAAPLLALARDLFRYVYGRFADPPRPAGMVFCS